MKHLSLFFCLVAIVLGFVSSFSQVKIGNEQPQPHSSSILDLQSSDKGLLLTRLNTTEIIAIPNPAEGLLIYNTTEKALVYYNGTTWRNMDGTSMNTEIAIGDFMAGGYVFYIDATGQHGLVCAPNDVGGTYHIWGCNGTDIDGADGTIIGTGPQNTIDIVQDSCATPDIAASLCHNFEFNEYSDWFLPSEDAVYLMWAELARYGCPLSDTFCPTAIGNFVANLYWSSSEINASSAWCWFFTNGTLLNIAKNSDGRVRPVRAF